MLTINVICVGKLKEKYLRDAIAEYSKRLSKYCKLNIIELSDEKVPDKINESIKKDERVKIAIVGKYIQLEDSYISVMESLRHAAFSNDVNVDIELIDSETITSENVEEKLGGLNGIVVPGGFGNRGI